MCERVCVRMLIVMRRKTKPGGRRHWGRKGERKRQVKGDCLTQTISVVIDGQTFYLKFGHVSDTYSEVGEVTGFSGASRVQQGVVAQLDLDCYGAGVSGGESRA